MKHYDHIEWMFYKKKVLPEEKMMEMDEHLYACNECLQTFLSLIDHEEVEEAAESIPVDFTSNIMAEIKNVEHMAKAKTNRSNKKYKEMLTYYIAVASVTIVLTMGGVFNRLVYTLPAVAQSNTIVDDIELPNIVADLSGRIVNKTSDLINKFEVSNIEEDGNERKE